MNKNRRREQGKRKQSERGERGERKQSGRENAGRTPLALSTFAGKALLVLVIAVFVVAFFAAALSHFDNSFKIIFCIADLFLAGVALHRLTGVESYYGILLLRGEAGFAAMTSIAKRFERACVWLADWGLAIGFGLPYAFYARRRQGMSRSRFALQALAALAFFAFVFVTPVGAGGAFDFAVLLFAGLFGFAFFFLAQHALQVLTVAQTPPGIIPVVPGVTIPLEAVVAVVVIAVVHEVAHGVLCKIIGLRLKNSGVLLLGWLPIGAFVEPDEQAFKRLRLRDKRRILVAGSTSNALFFVLFFFLTAACALAFPFFVASVSVDSTHYAALLPQGAQLAAVGGAPARTAGAANAALLKASAAGVEVETVDGKRAFVPPTAVVVKEALKGKPAEGILRAGDVVYSFGGARVSSITELKAALASRGAGETVSLETSAGEKKIVLAASASAAGGGEIGALFSQEPGFNAVDVPAPGAELLYSLFSLLLVILAYCFLLNFVLAAVNLLPIFITDGQRIFFEEFSAVPVLGKKKGAVLSFAVGLLTVALLVINALPWKTALGY